MARHLRELTSKTGQKRWELMVDGQQYAVIAPINRRRFALWSGKRATPEGVTFPNLQEAVNAALDIHRRESKNAAEAREAWERIRARWAE